MKLSKKVSKQVEKGIDKGKEYAWRIIVVAVVVLGLILIGRPLVSLIGTSIEIRNLNKKKALYEESIQKDIMVRKEVVFLPQTTLRPMTSLLNYQEVIL